MYATDKKDPTNGKQWILLNDESLWNVRNNILGI